MRAINSLSLVVPTYNQERTILKDITKLNKILSTLSLEYEIIVVVDGFTDQTYKKLKTLKDEKIKVFGYDINKGKGYAIRFGMSKAEGQVIGFIDSDLDIEPTGVSMLLNHMIWYDADIIVGSKLHPVSQVYYPTIRKILSWGYRTFTHVIFGFRVRDTQVGLKIFKKKVVRDIFPRLLVKKFAFDIEILAVAYSFGYKRIFEAPIKLNFKGNSSISSKNFWKIIFSMLWDTAAVFYRLKVLHYYDDKNRKKWLS